MHLLDLSYINFRNLKDNNLKFSPKFNLFYGKNGQGKTSILESIYFSITGQSFRTKKTKEVIQYQKEKSGTYINYCDQVGERSLSVRLLLGSKMYMYNNKKIKYDDFIGKVNVISFIPEDIELIMGSPGKRRNFFDYEIAQSNQIYYQELKRQKKLLKLRNTFLKDRNTKDPLFDIYNQEFIKSSVKIFQMKVPVCKKYFSNFKLKLQKII